MLMIFHSLLFQRYYQALVAYHQELFTILQSDFEYAMYWLLNFVLLEHQTMEDESKILERKGKKVRTSALNLLLLHGN